MTYETFPDEVKQDVCEAQNGFCLEDKCYKRIHSYHHKLPNTDYNRKKFPLFIHSPFNCAGLCFDGHTNRSNKFKVTENEAGMYERYLKKMKGKK